MISRKMIARRLYAALACLLLSAGCAQTPQLAESSPPAMKEQPPAGIEGEKEKAARDDAFAAGLDAEKIRISEHDRGQCYSLQPGAAGTGRKGHRSIGRCQPQSLIYARCRTGITTCRLGNTSPVQWFLCAKRSGNTTARPVAGAVMVLDGNSGRGMPTGHPVYVEQVWSNGDGTWRLRISHTNYDRKCHLDKDTTVLFNQSQMTASFKSGPWNTWAGSLKVLGFILR
jgi:hypothetical protein